MADEERPDLGQYDGRDIITASIVIPGAGGGLHDALTLDPVLLHTGDEIDVLLRCKVEDIRHSVIKDKGEDTGDYDRVSKLVVLKGTILADKTVGDKTFAKMATRLAEAEVERRKREEAAAGVQPIPGTEDL